MGEGAVADKDADMGDVAAIEGVEEDQVSGGKLALTHGDADAGLSPAEVLDLYATHIERVQYTGSANLIEERRGVYGSWLARTLQLEQWPRSLRRALENVFWSVDRRYIYVDHPELDDVFLPHYVLRASAGLVVVALLLASGIGLRRVSRGQGSPCR